MKKNYTVTGIKSLKNLPMLDLAQITLNSRVFPTKRRTVESLYALRCTDKCDIPLVIHADFVYIVSRYGFLSQAVRNAIVSEVSSILSYAETDEHILGIVMHTDFPLRKSVIGHPEKVAAEYASSIWNVPVIESVVDQNIDPVAYNINEFYQDLKLQHPVPPRCKVLLENTTKTGAISQGTPNYLYSLIVRNNFQDYFGMCVDTEHCYASTGMFPSIEGIKKVKDSGIEVLVHLNPIPEEVKPSSGLDRHSQTTLSECSVNSLEFYHEYTDKLDELSVPYVRECYTETMNREIEQLWQK